MQTKPNEFSNKLNALMAGFPENVVLGKPVNDTKLVMLRRPSFDCNWYWGFGYLGNRDCHYHLSGLTEGKNINMFDAMKEHFGDSLVIKDDKLLWQFCEVVTTIYTLRKSADMYHLGGSHYTTNPCSDSLKRLDWYTEINEVLIPEQIAAMYAILAKAVDTNTAK